MTWAIIKSDWESIQQLISEGNDIHEEDPIAGPRESAFKLGREKLGRPFLAFLVEHEAKLAHRIEEGADEVVVMPTELINLIRSYLSDQTEMERELRKLPASED